MRVKSAGLFSAKPESEMAKEAKNADQPKSKRGRPPKAKPNAAAPGKVNFNSELDQEEKALFLNVHLPAVKRLRALLLTANSNLRGAYKKALAEGGFTKADFDTAIAVETAENEARERAAIARKLKIAKIMGSSLGAQLDMFLEPDRTPAADIAFQEGESDALQNKIAKPKYDPSTEQARKYLEGFHSVSEKRIKEGIGKLDSEAAKAAKLEAQGKVEADLQKAQDAKTFDQEPNVGAGQAADAPQPPNPAMTRSQFKAQQEAAKGAGKPN